MTLRFLAINLKATKHKSRQNLKNNMEANEQKLSMIQHLQITQHEHMKTFRESSLARL